MEATNTCNMPMPFPGTPAEIEANWKTHYFVEPENRCMNCDCRAWGRLAEWPCGTDVPRTEGQLEDWLFDVTHRMLVIAETDSLRDDF